MQEAAGLQVEEAKAAVLRELARIVDPDFGMDIVACGFVKGLQVGTSRVILTGRVMTTGNARGWQGHLGHNTSTSGCLKRQCLWHPEVLVL